MLINLSMNEICVEDKCLDIMQWYNMVQSLKIKKSMNKDAHAYHISSIYPSLEVLLHDLATCDTSLTRVEWILNHILPLAFVTSSSDFKAA